MDGGRSFSCWSELQQEKPVVHDSHRGGGSLFSLMGCGRGLFKLKPSHTDDRNARRSSLAAVQEPYITGATRVHVETIWMSPGSFAVRVQLKQDRGRSVTTLIGAVDAEQRPQVFTKLSYRVPRRRLKRLARVVIRRLYGTCYAHSHGAHGKTLPQRCRPLKSMLLPGSADCTDSSFRFFFLYLMM